MAPRDDSFDYFSEEMFELRGYRSRLRDWKRCNKDQAEPVKFRDDYNRRLESLGIVFKTPEEEEDFWNQDNERMRKLLLI